MEVLKGRYQLTSDHRFYKIGLDCRFSSRKNLNRLLKKDLKSFSVLKILNLGCKKRLAKMHHSFLERLLLIDLSNLHLQLLYESQLDNLW